MIVADTSSLISLATIDTHSLLFDEFDVHTTETVLQELEETSQYDDTAGEAAKTVLQNENRFTDHETEAHEFQSSRIDPGEGSCIQLTRQIDPAFLITDDLRALPEVQTLVDCKVAISPIVLKALLQRGVLERDEARGRVHELAENRDWLGAPIYRRAQQLFSPE